MNLPKKLNKMAKKLNKSFRKLKVPEDSTTYNFQTYVQKKACFMCALLLLYLPVTQQLQASTMRRPRNQHTFEKKQSSRKHIKETAWGNRGEEIKIVALMAE